MKKILIFIIACLISTSVNFAYAEQTPSQENLNAQLLEAVEKGNLEQVKELIAAGADVNYIHNEDLDCEECEYEHVYSVLSIAVNKGNAEIVKELLKAGANVDELEIYQCDVCYYDTILQVAARNGNLEIVKELIKAGADPNGSKKKYKAEIPYYNNPLVAAAKKGYLDIVKEFLKIGPNIGLSEALYKASNYGYTEITKELVKAGADVNYKDETGYTPLSVAKKNGHNEIVKILIDAGADINAESEDGTALSIAQEKGNTEIVELLKSYGTDEQLLEASKQGNFEEVKRLIEEGANVNAGRSDDDSPTSPLYLAIDTENKELIKFLIEKGANVNFEDYDCGQADCSGDSSSPLIKAVRAGNKEIVEMLLDNGAEIDLEVYSGDDLAMSALRAAIEKNNKDMIDLLLKRGSKDIAIALARPDLLTILLKNGADINAVFSFENCGSIVDIAKDQEKPKLVEFFISKGAKDKEEKHCSWDFNRSWCNIDEQLIVASITEDLPLVQTLLEYGANLKAKDRFGDTVFSRAKATKNKAIIEILNQAGAKE